ncbi:hypothetical protein Taro_047398 [Colocasia esculenta]|uniref:Protein kinase domain-containing protein n=1 Tax=Colocasia esculenta TaxID=4460 RepID=A0A843X3T6_COLES|nr:hypothetical protein [Colocasia esculenta]
MGVRGSGGNSNSSGGIIPSYKQKRSWKQLVLGKAVPGTGTSRESPAGDAAVSDRHFIGNGARLFEALIASSGGNTNPIRMFSATELMAATDDYNPERFLGEGIWKVYGGVHDGRPIAVKRAFTRFFVTPDLILNMFLNEVVSLSQINHRNVVRLLGCCIETRAPILVYELVSGGVTLHQRIHSADASSRIPWADRLRIAIEVANAINYLHTSLRVPIVHGMIISKNIFLDGCCCAKVGAFGYSELVFKEVVQGSSGRSGSRVNAKLSSDSHLGLHVTEKDDVYDFGMLVIELLTGKMPTEKYEGGSRYMHLEYFVSSARGNLLGSVLDASILSETDWEQLMACAYVALRCVTEDVEGRPTMKESVQELRRIRGY